MEAVSIFPNEGEVLFFPFSSFEIKDIKEMKINNEKNMKLDSEFKKQLFEYGLIN